MKTTSKVLTAFLLVLFALPAQAKKDDKTPPAPSSRESLYQSLEPLTEALLLAMEHYVDEAKSDPQTLVYGALHGMIEQLDPFSSFMEPVGFSDMQAETEGEFGGLGIEIGFRDGRLTVVTPIEDTPADKAGVKAGDRIVKIEQEFTEGMEIQDAVHKLRGLKGTKVTITVARGGYPEPLLFTITRDTIRPLSVKSQLLEGGLGYLRLTDFMKNTADESAKALREMKDKGAIGYILDLRNNPGGLLDQSAEVSGLFLPGGVTIVSTQGRSVGSRRVWTNPRNSPFKDLPLVVLVNKGSASASEIVAGALQDHKRGVLMGETTFGKGSVQTIFALKQGKGADGRPPAVRLTTAYYYLPGGRKIHEKGVDPDIRLEEPKPQMETLRLFNENAFEKFAKHWLNLAEIKVKDAPARVKVDGDVFAHFIEFARDLGLRPDADKVKIDEALIQNVLAAEFVRFSEGDKGEEAARKIRISRDPWVLRAGEIIRAVNLSRKP